MTQQIASVFAAQQAHKHALRQSTAEDRLMRLKKLRTAIESREELIFASLQEDLRKSRFESALTEVYFVYAEIDHAIKNLGSWMEPRKTRRSLSNGFANGYIRSEPRGNSLILAPWNYPFQLAVAPLVSALAAGNTAIVKPSELSPATSRCIHTLLNETLAPEDVWCIEGDAATATHLTSLPFDHIFFTGSTEVGRKVMAAAAGNLSAVTLELGGKSPCVLAPSANLQRAAGKIAWGKLINSGQTCIAPDHVYVHESQLPAFIDAFKQAATAQFFHDNSTINPESYVRMVSRKHFDRQQALLDNALAHGASVVWGGESDVASLTFLPALLTNVPPQARVMQEEIFGPLLPIVTYRSLEEVSADINTRPTPLALYFFGRRAGETERFLKSCSSGGACVNDVLIHISNPALPFGGSGPSGTGSSHGLAGFRAFSHERSVLYQAGFDIMKLVYPPYRHKTGLLKWLKKFM